MKYAMLPLILALSLLSGCILSVRGGFSPVQGPLAQQAPIPTYNAIMTGAFSGTIKVTLADGEVCKGSWSLFSTKSDANAPTPAPSALATEWDLVYGPGYYVAHVLGNRLYVRTTLNGNRGTTMDVELSNENNKPGNTRGIALDNHGDLFKVSVYN